MTKLCRQFVLFSLLLSLSLSSFSQSAKYSITDESWSPYWIVHSKNVSGILNDIMLQLDQRTASSLTADQPCPPKRAQKRFKEGDTQIECCVNEAWRASEEQVNVSLWTDTLMTVEEVLIFPVGKSFEFNKLEDLQDKLISTVRGYGYVGSEFFIRSDSSDNISQIQKVALERADAGIIDRAALYYALKNSKVLKERYAEIEIGPVINRSDLKIRIHNSRPELLESINMAVRKMKQDGTIEKIIDSYK
ncbi:substrate-binding periplasmic protein [Psychromonas ossibalaenae]|uniref:substrate-binding periplasmic protein n=1 Tax=Psychromonas ossibalaenae TaxID=444922 RepID=UPI000360B12C|nr:transporter substrate-binding domain-containing protein [Psychromonas ossibalaenae]